MACRGTGQVISAIGDTPATVACPWCGGGGIRLGEIDAQARWLAEDTPADGGPQGAPDSAA
jgi:hypothetical protein